MQLSTELGRYCKLKKKHHFAQRSFGEESILFGCQALMDSGYYLMVLKIIMIHCLNILQENTIKCSG